MLPLSDLRLTFTPLMPVIVVYDAITISIDAERFSYATAYAWLFTIID